MSDYSDLKSLANNYRESIADSKNPDMFSLGYQWADKPHRHVYDLCKKLEEAADAVEALEAENAGFLEQLALRSESNMHKDMQEIMRINNQLNARIAELEAENVKLREALKPFVDMAPCFKEYRMPGVYYPIQEAHLKHRPVYSRQLFIEGSDPAESVIMHLFVYHFDRARAAYLGENKS